MAAIQEDDVMSEILSKIHASEVRCEVETFVKSVRQHRGAQKEEAER